MIYLNISLLVLIIASAIFMLFLNKKVMELSRKINNVEEMHRIRLNDVDKKIKIINNKKW